jgi:hypothetical protein
MGLIAKKTDADVIASVRLRQRLRRPIGVFLMVLGMLAFVATVRTVNSFKQTLSDAVELAEERREEVIKKGHFGNIFVVTHEAAYRSGKSLAYGTLLGLLMFSLGVAYAAGSKREDDLLIRCFDELNPDEKAAG